MDDLPIMCPSIRTSHFERFSRWPVFQGFHICRLKAPADGYICWTHTGCHEPYVAEPEAPAA